MAAEAPQAAAAKPPQQQPFCSSVVCRVLGSVPFFVAGTILLRKVRHAVGGQPERLRKPSVFVSLGFAVCLITWGMTLFVHAPRKKTNP